LKSQGRGWAQVDAVLVTGGSSRMPMVRNMLAKISGTTPNQTLSPDQSICHGAAYYAGVLQSGRKLESSTLVGVAQAKLGQVRQQSVSGRGLGILIRDKQLDERRPHYLIPANTPLPCAYRQRFGTAMVNQNFVHLHIVESGTSPNDPHVEIGECRIEGLPERLPAGSPVEVTIRYDEQARIHVEATDMTSGAKAQTTIIRTEPVSENKAAPITAPPIDPFVLMTSDPDVPAAGMKKKAPPVPRLQSAPSPLAPLPLPALSLEHAERPVPLCNRCGQILDVRGQCSACQRKGTPVRPPMSRPGEGNPSPKGTSDSSDAVTEPLEILPKPRPQPLRDVRRQ